MLFYTTVVGSIGIIVVLLVLRTMCGERIRDLNLRAGAWWKDILLGIELVVVTLGLTMLLSGPLMSLFPSEPGGGAGNFLDELDGEFPRTLLHCSTRAQGSLRDRLGD